jgi:guanylate kinase
VEYLKNKITNDMDIELHIIYIAADYVTRKHRALEKRKDALSVFDARCNAEEEQFINFECNMSWHKRIQNNNFETAFSELEKYIVLNNNLEDI